MKRTNSLLNFVRDNRALLWLTVLLLVGVGAGVAVYSSFEGDLPSAMQSLLVVTPAADGFREAVGQWLSACFQPMALLLVLFLSGVSALGAPAAMVTPLFWGVGLGLSLANAYTHGWGGVLFCAAVLLPPSLPKAAALLIGGVQSLRLSSQMLCQLMPHGARCGGLWQAFRLCCLRFLLVVPLLLLAGAMDVGLRALLLRFFPAFGG